jgi:excisionase family DNA binding protein
MDWVDVNEAAAILEVDPRQVRNLVAHGLLDARKVGRMWLISEEAVEERARSKSGPGRPVSVDMSWLLLAALDADSSGDPIAELSDDRNVRWRLRSSLDRAPSAAKWPAWLRHRGERRRLWLHPAALERFAQDPRVVRPDLSNRLGVRVSDLVPFYVSADDLADVVADYRGRLDDGDLPVMVVSGVREDLDWRDAVEVAALVDLVGARDARVAAAARDALDAAVAGLAALEPA